MSNASFTETWQQHVTTNSSAKNEFRLLVWLQLNKKQINQIQEIRIHNTEGKIGDNNNSFLNQGSIPRHFHSFTHINFWIILPSML